MHLHLLRLSFECRRDEGTDKQRHMPVSEGQYKTVEDTRVVSAYVTTTPLAAFTSSPDGPGPGYGPGFREVTGYHRHECTL
ncbi:uncharacterized protein SPSK_05756 [Sporothrix schenckii 1099-18]|uniref:Uncharacterized protein n=1 Tax=Sporothrix schenckii 1099-18 TaxID=1397361 RepID=A0A0F2LW14_SPOSC|nr:uncharacterized protein SPSK_05756 [Sporothrix schenckii 1099-18]KJR80690.1 hypothetical protein SPSK_05756 [Sporothrix schenckii 1099-18]